jgi:hypothetical protein
MFSTFQPLAASPPSRGIFFMAEEQLIAAPQCVEDERHDLSSRRRDGMPLHQVRRSVDLVAQVAGLHESLEDVPDRVRLLRRRHQQGTETDEKTGLLPRLPDGTLRRRLAGLDATAGEIPPAGRRRPLTRSDEKNPPVRIENQGIRRNSGG